MLLREEDSTNDFAMHNAQTISLEKLSIDPLRVDETVKMEKLELPSKEWLLSEASTVPEVRPHPTWVARTSGFWKRVSRLWQLFKK